MKDC